MQIGNIPKKTNLNVDKSKRVNSRGRIKADWLIGRLQDMKILNTEGSAEESFWNGYNKALEDFKLIIRRKSWE